jgi:hypothetical protein
MPYIINKTNGAKITTVQDGTIDTTSLDIILVGKNYTGYGETFNENFVKMLENFASVTQPAKKITGQLWFDATSKKIKVYDGLQFKSIGIVENGDNKPSGYNAGDLWFNKSEGRLYAYSGAGTNWILVGPLTTRASVSGPITTSITADDNTDNDIVKMVVNGTDAFVSSTAEFVPNDTETDFKLVFPKVKRGITLASMVDSLKGISYDRLAGSGNILWGTAATAMGLVKSNGVYLDADDYLPRAELASFSGSITVNNDDGLLLGSQQVLKIHMINGTANISHVGNNASNTIRFNVSTSNLTSTSQGAYYNIFSITTGSNNSTLILPNSTTTSYIGTASQTFSYGFFNTLTATTINGTAISGTTVRDNTNRVITNITLTAQGGLSGGGSIAGPSGTLAFTNTGILSITGTTNQISVTAGQNPTLSLPQSIHTAAAVTFSSVTAGTINGDAIYDNTARVVTTATIAGYAVTNLQGTANQVSVSASLGTVTVSTPQNIHSGASPTFNGLTLSSLTASGTANVYGTWQLAAGATFQATFADLAERYAADAEYDPGTVLVVGGEFEVTTTSRHGDTARAGIVSTAPAYTLNATAGDDDTHPYIAIAGRVPCKVIGPISKGDLLVTSTVRGFAERAHANDNPNATIARALETFEGAEGVIEVMVV